MASAFESRGDGVVVDENPFALVYIQSSKLSELTLRQAAQRIKCQIRGSDAVLLLKTVCAIVLPATSLTGAEAVARRLSPLLTGVEYEMQILCEGSAYTALL